MERSPTRVCLKRDVGDAGQIDRLKGLGLGEFHDFGGSQCGGEEPIGDMVPSTRSQRGGVTEATLHFIGECNSQNDLLPGALIGLSNCQYCGNIVRRMGRLLREIGIVKIQISDEGAIGEGREVRECFVTGPPDGRSRGRF